MLISDIEKEGFIKFEEEDKSKCLYISIKI